MNHRAVGWLIEKEGHEWLRIVGSASDWTTDSAKALRFARKEDAEQCAALFGTLKIGPWKVTEHAWMEPMKYYDNPAVCHGTEPAERGTTPPEGLERLRETYHPENDINEVWAQVEPRGSKADVLGAFYLLADRAYQAGKAAATQRAAPPDPRKDLAAQGIDAGLRERIREWLNRPHSDCYFSFEQYSPEDRDGMVEELVEFIQRSTPSNEVYAPIHYAIDFNRKHWFIRRDPAILAGGFETKEAAGEWLQNWLAEMRGAKRGTE